MNHNCMLLLLKGKKCILVVTVAEQQPIRSTVAYKKERI